MEPIHLFDLAAKQARWLAVSQSLIASNVSNANTPGYQAKAVQPFAELLDKTQLQMASSGAGSLGVGSVDQSGVPIADEASWETTESGNSVSLEQEMIKAGDVHRDFALNTNIVKAFHGMLMASVKA